MSTDPQGTRHSTTQTNRASFQWTRAALLLVLLAGFALRLLLIDTFSLREDEALYGFWARSVWSDPRFLHIFPDKPPIFLWLQAIALSLFGATSAGARVMSIFAATVTVALVAAGARRLWHGGSGGWVFAITAALLLALNPFAIAFAPTGYTDSLLVCFGVAGVVLGLRGRYFWAGVLTAAAIFTKQQGVFFLPLILLLSLIPHSQRPGSFDLRLAVRGLGLALLGVLALSIPLFVWDASRWSVAPSPWDLGAQNYAAIGFATLGELGRRAAAWRGLLWYGAASGWAWALYAALGVLAAGAWWRGRTESSVTRWGVPLLALWMVALLAAHLFSTVPAWDRYLLPVFPVFAMLLAGAALWLCPAFSRWKIGRARDWRNGIRHYGDALLWASIGKMALTVLLVLLLISPALRAARGELPIGGDHGDYSGIDDAAHFVAQEARERPVSIYHRALGWNLGFALLDAAQSGRIDLRWFPNGVYLADNVTKNPARRALVIEPEWAATRDLRQHAAMRGLTAREIARFGKMTVTEITQPADFCDWCANHQVPWQRLPAGAMSKVPAAPD